jgi:hypothetical protein
VNLQTHSHTHPLLTNTAGMSALAQRRPGKTKSPELTCLIIVGGSVPQPLLEGLPDIDALSMAVGATSASVETTLVGVVSAYSELHELLAGLASAGLQILSASAGSRMSPQGETSGG